MRNKFKTILKFLIVTISIFFMASCDSQKEIDDKQKAFAQNVETAVKEEIALEYNEGDILISELADGTRVQWYLSGTPESFFTRDAKSGNLICNGSNVEEGVTLSMIARFVSKDNTQITYQKEFEFNIIDNKIRNNENGIVDANLYDFLRVIADSQLGNGDGKITKQEALAVTGDVLIRRDPEGIVGGRTIETTKGLEHFPNIESLTFYDLQVKNLILDGVTELRTLEFDNDTTIQRVELSNVSKLEKVTFSDCSINSLVIGPNINLNELDVSNKNLVEVAVSDTNVTIGKFNLSGNTGITNYNFLDNVNGLLELKLSRCDLTNEKVKTIPSLLDVRALDLSQNTTLGEFVFITCDKFPALQTLNLRSNAINQLTIEGFKDLTKIELEQLQDSNATGIEYLVLRDLPKFNDLERSTEIRISNLTLENIPSLKVLDLSVNTSFEMTNLNLKNCGISNIVLDNNVSIRNINMDNLYNLKHLGLKNIVKSSLVFKDMLALESLELDSCSKLKDFAFINEAPNLLKLSMTQLDLNTAKLSKVTACTKLVDLNISYNGGIKDYSFLANFPSLQKLDVSNNKINDEVFATIEKHDALKEINLSYNNRTINEDGTYDNDGMSMIYFDGFLSLEKVVMDSNNDEPWHLTELRLENLENFKTLVRVASTKIDTVILTNLPSLTAINLGYSDVTKIIITNVLNLTALNIAGCSNVEIELA